jgi:predicted AlkP superfamily phosphohydrolase/phosphomutase
MARHKMILIGLDGGTWKLLKKWIDDGSLPNLAKLYANGARGILLSTVPSATCPAVPSLFTGKNPGNTGIFDFVDPYGSPIRLGNIRDKKVWNVLHEHKMSSLMVDVRFIYPTEPVDGVMISSVPIPKEVDAAFYPPDLEKKLGRRILVVPLFRDHMRYAHNRGAYKEEFLASLKKYAEERISLIKDLSAKRDYDFIFTWFGDVDAVCHGYWNDLQIIKRHLILVDSHIGRLIEMFPDRNMMIISDHGFHKEPTASFLVNMWLKQENLLETKGTAAMRWLYKIAVSVATKFFRKNTLLKLLGRKQKVQEGAEGERLVLGDNYRNIMPGVNWKTTKAYFRKPWGIQIIGRNLDGEYDKFRDSLMAKMRNVKGPDGKAVFTHVWKREEIFKGRYLAQIPDIVYQMDEEYHPDYIISSGALIRSRVRRLKTTSTVKNWGDHVMDREGIFLAFGPDFRKGIDIKPACIEDVAPTIYHLMDSKIPDDLDGKIILEALSDSMRNKPSSYYRANIEGGFGDVQKPSEEEDESIREQLRNMGYLQD